MKITLLSFLLGGVLAALAVMYSLGTHVPISYTVFAAMMFLYFFVVMYMVATDDNKTKGDY